MTKSIHRIYIGMMVFIVILSVIYLTKVGITYYRTPLEERFYHPNHMWFKPSGIFGHGLGIVGTGMILFGVVIYIARKRYNFLGRYIRLKYLLEFHIFLCVLGPILILFHTAFKFGGIVSIAFWSMVAVVLSGVIGRFIYIQIPRTIEGREISLNELKTMRQDFKLLLKSGSLSEATIDQLSAKISFELEKLGFKNPIQHFFQRRTLNSIMNKELKIAGLSSSHRKIILTKLRDEITLGARINRLHQMQKLFKYWHVAHLPFALIMLIIVIIHVIVTLMFGYKWIF